MPVDDFKKINFSQIGAEEIKQWVDMKQTYRAAFIKQAKLPPELDYGQLSESDYSDAEVFSSLYEEGEDEDGQDPEALDAFRQRSGAAFGGGRGQKRLPDTLLSHPLPPAQVLYLNQKDEKDYYRQKAKYEAELRKIQKQEKPPGDTEFDLRMARQLINGQFWLEDEEINEQENELNLKNAQVFGKTDPTEQLQLDQFEKQLIDIMKQSVQGTSVDDLLGNDNIPPEIREEFNLPEDMKG